ncbi:hypothetical protein PTKIN_Ptkin14bG0222700 [Pterospermum kingtungense]
MALLLETRAVLGQFSKSIGSADSNLAEFFAIREAPLFFVASDLKDTHHLIIESDSSNAVNWCNDSAKVSWRMRNFSNHMMQLGKKLKSISITHIPREQNSIADELAKSGAMGS